MALPTLSFYSKSPCPIFFPLIKHTLALRRPLPNQCRAAAADGGAPLQSTASTSNLSSIFCSVSLPTLSPEMKKPIKDNSGGIEDLTLFCDEETSEISSTDKPIFRVTLGELMLQSRIKPSSVYGDLNVPISGIQDDSREVVAGDLFICRVGSRKDGHEYLEEAISKGAVAIVADRELKSDKVFGCRAAVIVEDTQSAIPLLAASFYRRPSEKLSVIGVTGTNGKTTTTHLIKSVYEAMGWRTGMLGTVGYFVHGHHQLEAANTTPDALVLQKLMSEMVENGSKAVVMEASSHGLALGRCNEIDFDVAVFTNLTRDHLDFHGTTEEYRKSKGKLFDKMLDRKKHRKVVNIDDPNAFYFIDQGNPDVPVVTYAMENKDADVRPLDFQLSLFKTRILVGTPKGSMEIFSKLIGRHNIYNILATVAVGIAMDLPVDAIVRGIGEMDGVPGRCELIDEMQEFAVIVDYAHSPDALSRLLDAVRELSPKRVITVFGCGGERDRGKRPLMTKVAAEKSDLTILTSDNPRNEDPMEILDDMLAGVGWTVNDYLRFGESDCYPPLPNNHRIFVHENRRVAVRAAVAMGREGDMVVIAGKGHEAYQIEGNKKKFFDDRIECREGLQVVKNLQQEGIDTRAFPWWLPHRY
ncbi:hypothetical protein AXF42_Ash002011 [Apostasia shenzhenica]|uniref:UDP-N-acetylmuramoyl-L-alanyl-D-glutamate--2,6-diaminopimelate ligase MurE homolog, chloroplastic n=1 Tax=Apostasia shenzhenica TaxID=1088818 RepID=A0A2I0ABV8_9ASPA|nr:hypothetical protein AXF42_Ash002011 [Apostasia shenzhenica]